MSNNKSFQKLESSRHVYNCDERQIAENRATLTALDANNKFAFCFLIIWGMSSLIQLKFSLANLALTPKIIFLSHGGEVIIDT